MTCGFFTLRKSTSSRKIQDIHCACAKVCRSFATSTNLWLNMIEYDLIYRPLELSKRVKMILGSASVLPNEKQKSAQFYQTSGRKQMFETFRHNFTNFTFLRNSTDCGAVKSTRVLRLPYFYHASEIPIPLMFCVEVSQPGFCNQV